ncbi:MAG: hypothetical protein IJG75_02535, partial [Spirochaetia bacterium]|nr:hypothetical protein [Spirochaetia bacterium]
MRKFFILFLASMIVLSFASCGGGGGGGSDEEEEAATWPVSYRADLHALDPSNPEGSFAYV